MDPENTLSNLLGTYLMVKPSHALVFMLCCRFPSLGGHQAAEYLNNILHCNIYILLSPNL
jgi:hypothetical protein